MSFLGKAITLVVLYSLQLFYLGYTVAKLWQWFMVPLGLPAIAWRAGLGIAILISITAHQTPTKEKREFNDYVASLVGWCVSYSLALLIAMVLKGGTA